MKIPTPAKVFRYLATLFDPRAWANMEDGYLRLLITSRCNARCRFCTMTQGWLRGHEGEDMDPRFLYEYCLPLYPRIKFLNLVGGEPLFAKEALPFARFIQARYPGITILFETNGITFDPHWREWGCEALPSVNFSLNGSNVEVFEKGCWEGPAARNAYRMARENLAAYVDLLKSKGLEAFAPGVSTVVDEATTGDIKPFLRLALEHRAKCCTFFFDFQKTKSDWDHFHMADSLRPVLKELMEIERVLAGKFQVSFRLFMPVKDGAELQQEVDRTPLAELQERHQDILALARDRSIEKDFQERTAKRKALGRRKLTMEEDWAPTLHQMNVAGRNVCFAPFKMLGIYPDGRVEFCSWVNPSFNICSYLHNGRVAWRRLFNQYALRLVRRRMLQGDYGKCMACCPMNPTLKPVCHAHQYGYNRIQTGNP